MTSELNIGDILYNYTTSSNDVSFDGNVLDALYEALTGKKGATYHDAFVAAQTGRNATAIANGHIGNERVVRVRYFFGKQYRGK